DPAAAGVRPRREERGAARVPGGNHRRGARGRGGRFGGPGAAARHAVSRPRQDGGREGALRNLLRPLLQPRGLRRRGASPAAGRAARGRGTASRRRAGRGPGRRRPRRHAARRRPRRPRLRDGGGRRGSRPVGHRRIHPGQPLHPPRPGAHGPGGAGARNRPPRRHAARRRAPPPARLAPRPGAELRAAEPALVRRRRRRTPTRAPPRRDAPLRHRPPRPRADARAGAGHGAAARGTVRPQALALPPRPARRAPHDPAQHGLGRPALPAGVEAPAGREAALGRALRRQRFRRRGGGVPAPVPALAERGAVRPALLRLLRRPRRGERHPPRPADRARHPRHHGPRRIRLFQLRQLASRLRGGLDARPRPPHHRHHPGRRAGQPHRPARGRARAHGRPVQAGHLAQPGGPHGLGHRRLRHAPLRAALPRGRHLRHAGAVGTHRRRAAPRRRRL
ncbi:MAG: Carbon monoxide oxidation accessory protein CoxE, partial [uncultured Acetobacteraceae bacterium]